MNSKSVKREGGIKSMYSKSKRFIASFLAVLMAVCMLPVDVLGGVGVVHAAVSKLEAQANGSTLSNNDEVTTETEITLVSDDNGETIYYAINGEVDITDSSQEYSSAFKLPAGDTVTLKASAVASGETEATQTLTLTLKVTSGSGNTDPLAVPTASETGAVASGTKVTLGNPSSNPADSKIYYSVVAAADVTTKPEASELTTEYTDGTEIEITEAVTIYAVVKTSDGSKASDVAEFVYTVNVVEKEGVYKLVFNEEFTAPSSSTNVTAGTYGTKKADGVTGYFSLGQGSSGSSGQICTVGDTPLVLPENNKLGKTDYIGAAFQSGGAGSASSNTKRTIQFTTQKAAKLTIGAYITNGDTDRTIYLSKGTTSMQSTTERTILAAPSEWSFNIDDGDWSICFTKSIRILYVFVEEVDVIPPSADPVAGIVSENQAVELSAAEGAVIYYTVDGSEPNTGSTVYSSAINITTTPTTIKAIAVKDGKTSEVQTFEYKFQVAEPVADVSAGIVTESNKALKVTSATAGAEIYYTVDGTTPSKENGKLITSDGIIN